VRKAVIQLGAGPIQRALLEEMVRAGSFRSSSIAASGPKVSFPAPSTCAPRSTTLLRSCSRSKHARATSSPWPF
jgi:hypothetical protein